MNRLSEGATQLDRSRRRGAGGARRLRWRLTVRVVAGVVALALVGVILVTQTPILKSVVLGRLEAMLGVDAKAEKVRIGRGLVVVIDGLSMRAPGLRGAGAEVMRAEQVHIDLRAAGLFGRGASVEGLRLMRPRLRVSVDSGGSLNLGLLKKPTQRGRAGRYPAVEVVEGLIEVGEHDGADYQARAEIGVRGGLHQRPSDPSVYDVELEDVTPSMTSNPEERLKVDGWLNADTGEIDVVMHGLDLKTWADRTAPGPYRRLWSEMNVRGRIDSARFAYRPGASVEAALELQAVDMNVPIVDAQGHRELLAMREVNGPISFTRGGVSAILHGYVEQIETSVTLRYDGVTEGAPFSVRVEAPRFPVEKRTALLGMAPEVVRKIFDRFSQPSMVLSGWVSATRGVPDASGVRAPVVSEGVVQVSEGVGRYEAFPYPFEQITGRVEFDAREVRVLDFRGIAPTGALLTVSGVIAPPNNDAAVDLRVTVDGVPVDGLMRASLPERYLGIVDLLIDEERLMALREQEIVLGTQQAAGLRERLLITRSALDEARSAQRSMVEIERLAGEVNELEKRAARPVFDPGGKIDLDIHISRQEGPDHEYVTRIDMRAPALALLPAPFPYPIIGRDVRVSVDQAGVTIEETRVDTPTGASGTVRGYVAVAHGRSARPELEIVAKDVPIDEVLMGALPGRAGEEDAGGSMSVAKAVRELAVRGVLQGKTRVYGGSGDEGQTEFTVDVTGRGLSARPVANGQTLALDDVALAMTVERQGIEVRTVEGRAASGWTFTGEGGVELDARGHPEVMRLTMRGTGFDLSAPIEAAVAPFAAQAAEQIGRTRLERQPSGRADVDAALAMVDGTTSYVVRFAALEEVRLNGWGGRLALDGALGAIELMPTRARFDDVDGAMMFDGHECGRVKLDGEVVLDGAGGEADEGRPQGGAQLAMTIEDGEIASPLVYAVAQATAPGLSTWIQTHALQGVFDAQVMLHTGLGEANTVIGTIHPRSLAMASGGEQLELSTTTGVIELSPTGGRAKLVGSGEGVALHVDGRWARDDSAPFAFLGQVRGLAPSLSAGLLAALPEGVRSARDAIELTIDGRVEIVDGELRLAWADEGGPRTSGFKGNLTFEGLSMNPGVPVERGRGRARIDAAQGADEAARVQIDLELDEARMATMAVTGVRGRVVSGTEPGSYVVQVPEGSMYGGRLSAVGAVRGLGGSAADGGEGEWEIRTTLDRIDFRAMLRDIRETSSGQPVSDDALPGRGDLFLDLSARGMMGTSERQGRGLLRLQSPDAKPNQEVLRLPGLVELVKLSNLQVPVDEPVTFAYAEWYIEGERLVFEEVSAESASVAVVGTGEMRWPGLGLDMTFTTRSLVQTPLLTELTTMLRDEVATARVTGSLYDPVVKYQQLQATRSLLDAIVSGDARRRDRLKVAPRQAGADEKDVR